VNCPRCTTPLPEHSRYCLACGASVSGDGEPTASFDASLLARLQEELSGEFVVEQELGRGGMALVFQAQDTRLGRKVAIKVLPPDLTFGRQDAVERFKREARTAATLDHPHIIPIYAVSGEGRLTWYTMKFLSGESLDKLLQRVWRLSVDATVHIVSQVAEALQHAHDQGVVHRDVKPANAMIDAKGWVTVTDFGIAKAMDAEQLTGTGSTIGTPFYMSPEQCSGGVISGASDQYALGVMTYQMLAGRVPFTGANVVDIIRRHCFDQVPPLQELRPELNVPVVQVINRALAKKPEDRFPSVTSFAKALELASKGVDVGLSYPATGAHMAADDTVIIDHVRDRRKRPRGTVADRKNRKRPMMIAAALAVLVAGGGATAVLKPWQRAAAADSLAGSTPPVAAVLPAADSAKQDTARSAPDTVKRAQQPAVPQEREPAPTFTRSDPPTVPQASQPALLTVGSRPASEIIVNGEARGGSPIRNVPVPAGRVQLRFVVTDSTGIWSHDTTIVVQSGQNYNLHYLTLRRP
jgi:serine/threonine protein kinase